MNELKKRLARLALGTAAGTGAVGYGLYKVDEASKPQLISKHAFLGGFTRKAMGFGKAMAHTGGEFAKTKGPGLGAFMKREGGKAMKSVGGFIQQNPKTSMGIATAAPVAAYGVKKITE